MGTVLKYIIYIALIAVVYFIIMAVWEEKVNEDSTVEEVVVQVGNDMGNATKNAMPNMQENQPKAQ